MLALSLSPPPSTINNRIYVQDASVSSNGFDSVSTNFFYFTVISCKLCLTNATLKLKLILS